MRSNYWSCSDFADKVRGTKKPTAATSEGWHDWNKLAKSAFPIRYWIAEELLDHIQDIIHWVPDQFDKLGYYLKNRFITRTHLLAAHSRDIKPGAWCDVGDRFLPVLFNSLVDFIEVEQAWHHVAWNKEERERYPVREWAKEWRSVGAGLAHLEWAMNLKCDDDYCDKDDPSYGKPTRQALVAREMLELYEWWTKTRRDRVDPYDASGWSAYCDERRENDDDLFFSSSEEDMARSKEILDKAQELEAKYEAEDEEMLIRLIKIRNDMWT